MQTTDELRTIREVNAPQADSDFGSSDDSASVASCSDQFTAGRRGSTVQWWTNTSADVAAAATEPAIGTPAASLLAALRDSPQYKFTAGRRGSTIQWSEPVMAETSAHPANGQISIDMALASNPAEAVKPEVDLSESKGSLGERIPQLTASSIGAAPRISDGSATPFASEISASGQSSSAMSFPERFTAGRRGSTVEWHNKSSMSSNVSPPSHSQTAPNKNIAIDIANVTQPVMDNQLPNLLFSAGRRGSVVQW